ncbi:MAG: hypothetical protein Q7U77_07760 [Sediminibacterium sp.]|uniref:hypothetical protein n=1 Tax=Sediminibacterium sp. TaxID=1917865 RepID=UPI002717F971|nr:hypothetical protein [Sediminibacterium sp.]MDO8996507.1 hypothetical protein [Sediminibacterium sp.]
MSSFSITDVSNSNDRYKLFVLECLPKEFSEIIINLGDKNIPILNIGKELALYLDKLEDYRYLTIDAYDYIIKLLEKGKTKINQTGNEVIAIYNLGVLFEPTLQINTSKLLKDFSKSTAVIIIWENIVTNLDLLTWETQKDQYNIDFSDTPLKRIQYAI